MEIVTFSGNSANHRAQAHIMNQELLQVVIFLHT